MASAPASRSSRWLLVVVLGAAFSFMVLWFWRQPPLPTNSPHDDALDHAIAPVLEQQAGAAKLGLSSPKQTRLLARQLALDSVPYLAPADLELWAALRLDAARSSRAACASLWQGRDDAFSSQAIVDLGEEKLQAWSELLARGLARRLERKPAPQPPPDAIARGMAAVAEQLPEAERGAFLADVSLRGPSDQRACQLFSSLFEGAQKLEPGLRIDLYRALAQRLRASSRPAAPAASH